jgi:Kef-type K+ transport system membrane component KefB
VVVGRSAELGSLDGLWLVAIGVLVVASLGKLGGAAIAARISGESRWDALAIGSLMNARGLTEVVVVTVGLELGVIGTATFTMMVLMALVTTVVAGPLTRWFLRHSARSRMA